LRSRHKEGMVADRFDTARFYTVKGRKLPSVTTILSVINKPAIGPWMAKMERLSIASILRRKMGEPITPELAEEVEKGPKAGDRAKAGAARTGHDIHAAIESYLKGRHPELDGIEAAFQLWLDWWKRSKLKVLDIEKTVYDLAA